MKRIGETLGEEDWRGGGAGGGQEEEDEEEQTALIKSNKPHLAGGEQLLMEKRLTINVPFSIAM